jgi:hypothetical protein
MTKQKSTPAKASSEIRKILKQNFPTIKFSVTSKSYSMGSSVNISWTDGVTTDRVEKLVKKFQYGHFDGMQDLYEYSNSKEDIPQVKYVQTKRNMSDETKEVIKKELGITDENAYNEDRQCWNGSVIYCLFAYCSF